MVFWDSFGSHFPFRSSLLVFCCRVFFTRSMIPPCNIAAMTLTRSSCRNHLRLGGEVDFKVNSGDLRIVRNQQHEQIRLEIHLQTKGFDTSLALQKWVRTFEVQGNHAIISLQLPAARRWD